MRVGSQWRSRFTIIGLVCGLFLTGIGRQPIASAATFVSAPNPDSGATSVPPFQLQSDEGTHTVVLSWKTLVTDSTSEPGKQSYTLLVDLVAAVNNLPLVEIHGAQLPAQLFALQLLTPNLPAGIIAATADSLAGAPNLLIPIPQLDSLPMSSLPNMAAPEVSQAKLQSQLDQLPTSPVFILRQGILRGHTIVVVALSPLFAQNGEVRIATRLQAQFANAQVLSPQSVAAIMDAPMIATEPRPIEIADPQAPTAQTVWRLTVSQAGIQRVTGQNLADMGMALAGLTPNKIHVRRQGADVALDTRGLDDGVFNPADEIRFYAPEPGDRWNATDAYFLSTELTLGPRMATRNVQAARAITALTLRSTATQRGTWRNNTRYESMLDGFDGDHWFASQLVTPVQTHTPNSVHIDLISPLPLVAGPVSITLFGTTGSEIPHTFAVRMGSATGQSPSDGSFHGPGNWAHSVTLSDNQPALDLQLTSTNTDSYTLDFLTYARPVQLNFGGHGGDFWSMAGAWAYQLEGLPAQSTIYDLTDVAAPVLLTDVENAQIHDNTAGTRHYWVSGTNAVAQPAITPDSTAQVTDADRWGGIGQIYIVPRALRDQLTPLLNHRKAYSQVVQMVDVELIYNTWSGGQISPTAIREFVRYAAEQDPTLRAITLVGDGSNDPRNFLGRNNPTLIPPYLAPVDPWLGEAACDTCYAQLNGDDPLSDWLPDVLIGRLPVKSAAELTQLVNKIIAYETAPIDVWNWRSGHLADNYQEANGQADAAGNFPEYQDAAVSLQPPDIDVRRAYFDPYLPSRSNSPWREADPIQTHQNTLALFNAGAAVINFQGHGYYDRLGETATQPGSSVNYLLHSSDVARLSNGSKLPMLIEMACWTGAFQQPLNGSATIDELLVLAPNGGAIATWGSTGWGVAYQHEYLQKGFYAALWATPKMDATVGDVAQQGLLSLFAEGVCCLDAMRTYALLGDPMTVLHAIIPTRILMPSALNQ